MAFIATYWWLWILGIIVFGVYPVASLINRTKSITGKVMVGRDPGGTTESFFKGLIPILISSILSSLCGLMLFISIVINIIIYAKTIH
jgi:hypothetical protein